MLPAEPAVLAQLEALGRLLLVLRRAVVAPLALGARQRDQVSHNGSQGLEPGDWPLKPQSSLASLQALASSLYSTISSIVPAPTVRPPSRIAKRAPFSSA